MLSSNSLCFIQYTVSRPGNSQEKTIKMSQAVSNLSLSLPLPFRKAGNSSKPPCPALPHLFKPIGGRGPSPNGIRAIAGETRDNLDHLQRANKPQQSNPKKRAAPVAPIGLWDRFPTARTMQQMMETMDRMMEDPFTYSGGWPEPLPSGRGGYSRGRTPWEIKEGESEYKMRFDMPGMTKEDVKVWVEEKMLIVKAEKVPKKQQAERQENGEEEDQDWSAKSYGRYSSRIALPENIQFEKIKAEVKDGVLYITIPKASSPGKVLDINVQ
ncbi:small heat shock protein, chloroplastic-like [Juglans regia]|uniref:Small heat shock protein, chloroplastic-like n=2 Tax=Juglans regia TaxID=51240 RepID=A0A6P9DXK1_JUGRE|nr:small heat shock protein, chloroplastic-like [Juglans regia]